MTMNSTVKKAPRIAPKEAVEIAHDLFNIKGTVKSLPSERDGNFRITDPDGRVFVLKIANADERFEILDFQNKAMIHINGGSSNAMPHGKICPDVCKARDGKYITQYTDAGGVDYYVRMLTYFPGKPLASANPHDPRLLEKIGKLMGHVDGLLAEFDHPGVHRYFYWDLKHAESVIKKTMGYIQKAECRSIISRCIDDYRAAVIPVLPDLRTGVIHNDANDYNLIVSTPGLGKEPAFGIIDFGDMVHTQVINEVAIACAYAMMGKRDPLDAAGHVVRGYHGEYPLTVGELSVLFHLVRMRLCTSVCLSADQYRQEPNNEYLRISEKQGWSLLKKLDRIDLGCAHYFLRHACGFSPVPHSQKIVDWVSRHENRFHPPIDVNKFSGTPLVLDLSVGSPLLDVTGNASDHFGITHRGIQEEMKQNKIDMGIGGYGEVRFVSPDIRQGAEKGEPTEPKTVHLGVDLFIQPGSPVYACMDGVVRNLVHENVSGRQRVSLIIEHVTDEKDPFFTQYGCLDPASVSDLSRGMRVSAGQRIAETGFSKETSVYPSHLHFQLIIDLVGHINGFPCYAKHSKQGLWTSISPDPTCLLGFLQKLRQRPSPSNDGLLAVRRRSLGRNLSIAYETPLNIVRGFKQYLISRSGRFYLDGVNNVSHVGHCHPHVVRAGQQQMAVLNTNTRYLHENIVAYSRRLLSKFPRKFKNQGVCFFVCTGSEANELALRMARAYTGRRDIITLDGAYHGNTQGLIDISPYKHDGPGGTGAPEWVHTVEMPDGYRGPHKGSGAETGIRYAEYVRDAIVRVHEKGRDIAAFICESMLGCGGQVILPQNYMKKAFDHVRAAGGICIADEVQVGFGRAGSHFWAFETQGVVPDIVTLGKPMGNGHPIAAVITTHEIAAAFANGMEYFNTFGGNPVSCAIGNAVLDVIEQENLQENARKVGKRLLTGLEQLADRSPLIGDVRGWGLYLGVELVTDAHTLAPAANHAAYICNRMKDFGILISTDGPLHNVLKLKPPIIFSEENADETVAILDRVLSEDCLRI